MSRLKLLLVALLLTTLAANISGHPTTTPDLVEPLPVTFGGLDNAAWITQLVTASAGSLIEPKTGLLFSPESIFDTVRSGIIICELRTCICADCQIGGPCVPVPPPPWCLLPY